MVTFPSFSSYTELGAGSVVGLFWDECVWGGGLLVEEETADAGRYNVALQDPPSFTGHIKAGGGHS